MKNNCMRNAFMNIAAAVCFLAAFAGCAKGGSRGNDAPPDTSAAATAVTESSADSAEPDAGEVLSPKERVYRDAEPADISVLPTATKGFYKLEMGEESDLVEYRDGLILCYKILQSEETQENYVGRIPESSNDPNDPPVYEISVYDPDKGLLLGRTDDKSSGFECYDDYRCGRTEEGFYSVRGNTARLLDPGLGETDRYVLPIGRCEDAWCSRDGRLLLVNEQSGSSRLFDMENKREITTSRRVRASYCRESSDGGFDIITLVSTRFHLSEDGTLTAAGELPYNADHCSYIPFIGGGSAAYIGTFTDGRDILWDPRGDEAVVIRTEDIKMTGPADGDAADPEEDGYDYGGSYLMGAGEGFAVLAGGHQEVYVIDTEKGRVTAPIKSDCLYLAYGSSSDERFMLESYEDGGGRNGLFLAVPSEMEYPDKVGCERIDLAGEAYKAFFRDPVPESPAAEKLLGELKDTYNVRVFFQPSTEENADSFGYYCKGYGGPQESVLRSLRDFLALSPAELLTSSTPRGRETWILICYEITEIHGAENSFGGVVGFATNLMGHPFSALQTPMNEQDTNDALALDGSYSLDYFGDYIVDNFSHEIIHLLDYRLTSSQEESWLELSPEDGYYDSYNPDPDDDRYIPNGEADNEVYFVDDYARTYLTEDRARIGENLYYMYSDPIYADENAIALYPPVTAKARELIDSLRANYPCLNSIPRGSWYMEQALDVLEENEAA